MRQVLLTVLALLVLVVASAASAPVTAAQSEGLTPDGVTIHIDIEGDGDARWTISTSYNLNDSSDREAFEDVASSFERGQGDVGFSLQAAESVLPQVAEQTGRDMDIRDPEWTSAVENDSNTRRGYLRLSFTWTNFAHVRNETVRIDNVFAGGWFGNLDRGQTLVIAPPSGFDVSSAQPSHETVNGTLRWTGPVTFGPSEPTATFERQPEPPGIPWVSIAGAVVTALVIGGIIAYAWFYRSSRGGEPTEAGTEEAAPPTATGGTEAAAEAEAETPTEADAAAEADTETETEDETEAEAEEAVPPELLSDEERVERLLEEHGGRMKQARIVEETRWSNAKVSQLLSQMAEEGRVEKLRIGRENLISLPEEDEHDES